LLYHAELQRTEGAVQRLWAFVAFGALVFAACEGPEEEALAP
jgi:hypothetical protein